MPSATSRLTVDVIIPVYNAENTIEAAIRSVLGQRIPEETDDLLQSSGCSIVINVCCYDDGSTDESWKIMEQLRSEYSSSTRVAAAATSLGDAATASQGESSTTIQFNLLIAKAVNGVSRGAGFARNRAAELAPLTQDKSNSEKRFLCLLDSDDVMHRHRVYKQVQSLLLMKEEDAEKTLLGCTFDRIPPDSTWHYAQWANGLTQERLYLEKFREITLVQPTWMMFRSWFDSLGGYIEAPAPDSSGDNDEKGNQLDDLAPDEDGNDKSSILKLIHPVHDTRTTLRVAEDLRFFHTHLAAGGKLSLLRTTTPLVTYTHRSGQSQSSQTPRRLLLQLRALAIEKTVLSVDPQWQGQFCVWGAGRDGKDFIKALQPDFRKRIACIADVDEKKIELGYYCNRDINVKIPIVHFSLLVKDPTQRQELQKSFTMTTSGDAASTSGDEGFGRINKGRRGNESAKETNHQPKKRKLSILHAKTLEKECIEMLPTLPVLVCVAMYRTGGALEHNVKLIGRTEGKDLWHVC